MRKLRLALLGTVLFLAQSPVSAQFTVSGTVLDSATREPLAGASVFAQNTTLGTATGRDGNFSLELKPGGYDIIFSYTGYLTRQHRVQAAENPRLEILLVKEDKSLSEVVVRSTNEVADGWEKYGNFFTGQFIGSTPNARDCSLLNPEVLKFFFSKRQNKLKVLATGPLQISNRALGYNLSYQLDSFVHHYNSDVTSYRGFCLYTEMDGPDSLRKIWARNRVLAYYGSKLHFMRSYYDSTLQQEGFIISMLDEHDPGRFNLIKDPYDTSFYVGADSSLEAEIWFPRKINVTYAKRTPEDEYLKHAGLPRNLGVQVSYVELKQAVAIKENGYYYDQKDWITQGYWSWKNLADQLPFDYIPDY